MKTTTPAQGLSEENAALDLVSGLVLRAMGNSRHMSPVEAVAYASEIADTILTRLLTSSPTSPTADAARVNGPVE